mgnify:CR=1 FL=1
MIELQQLQKVIEQRTMLELTICMLLSVRLLWVNRL